MDQMIVLLISSKLPLPLLALSFITQFLGKYLMP
jgi:hypothetical protein